MGNFLWQEWSDVTGGLLSVFVGPGLSVLLLFPFLLLEGRYSGWP